MLQIAKFHTDDPLRLENCVVMRRIFDLIEFGFPYIDVLPVKLSVSQCMDLINFIESALRFCDKGEALSFKVQPHDSTVEQIINIRRTFSKHFQIDCAFTDIDPVIVSITDIVTFSEYLNMLLAVQLIKASEEEIK